MPLLDYGLRDDPVFSDDFEAPMMDVLGATAEEVLVRSPVSSVYRMSELHYARQSEYSRKLSYQESLDYIGDSDLELEGRNYNVSELNILMQRKREERARQDIMRRAPKGFVAGAAEFTTGVVASALDPVNLAVSFLPVVGQARYASMLKAAKTPLARAGVRAKVGAIEGAAGALAVEPIVLMAADQEQADYGAMDSLMNIAFGTVLGGGLHMGAGYVKDKFRGIEQVIDDIKPEVHQQAARTAVAQVVRGERINVEPLLRTDPIFNYKTGELLTESQRLKTPDELGFQRKEIDAIATTEDKRISMKSALVDYEKNLVIEKTLTRKQVKQSKIDKSNLEFQIDKLESRLESVKSKRPQTKEARRAQQKNIQNLKKEIGQKKKTLDDIDTRLNEDKNIRDNNRANARLKNDAQDTINKIENGESINFGKLQGEVRRIVDGVLKQHAENVAKPKQNLDVVVRDALDHMNRSGEPENQLFYNPEAVRYASDVSETLDQYADMERLAGDMQEIEAMTKEVAGDDIDIDKIAETDPDFKRVKELEEGKKQLDEFTKKLANCMRAA